LLTPLEPTMQGSLVNRRNPNCIADELTSQSGISSVT
jgi:hypothetical protein